jgi:glycosyltransferase involved in cell wall biosynthesis
MEDSGNNNAAGTINKKIRVTFFQRRPLPAYFSIERIFSDVRRELINSVDARIVVSRFPSQGLLGRLYNIIEAAFRQGEVNHVTGDVHFLAALLRKKKTILTIHDLVSVYRLKGTRRKAFLFFWYWLPIKRAAMVTVISQATKEELSRHINIDPQKVRVIYDCVSEDFQPAPGEFRTGKPVILQVGTDPHKNLERVAVALHGIPCHLRVIGRPSDRQSEILQRGEIEYSTISNIPDQAIVAEYQRCDLLAFASTHEGFGLPIVEAQATGRPVVTSNRRPMSEVAGGAACLVDPFDAASIREGILKTINDSAYRNNLVRRGFRNIERFKAGNIAAQYLDVYRQILNAG